MLGQTKPSQFTDWRVFVVKVKGPPSSQFQNNYFTEMCSVSEAGSCLRLIDFVYHSTLGLRVIKKKKCTELYFFIAAKSQSPSINLIQAWFQL